MTVFQNHWHARVCIKFSSLILSENSTFRSKSPSNIQGLGNYHCMFDLFTYVSLLVFMFLQYFLLRCACAVCMCMSKMSKSVKKTEKLNDFDFFLRRISIGHYIKNTKSYLVNMRQRKKTEPLPTEYFSSILKFKVAEGWWRWIL